MPPIWKVLIIGVLCLGIVPSWGDSTDLAKSGAEKAYREELGTSKVLLENENQDRPKVEDVLTEKVTEEDLQMSTVSQVKTEESQEQSRSTKPIPEEKPKEVKVKQTIQPTLSFEASLDGFEHLGIKKLSPGISIFRFSHFFIKNHSPLARGKYLSDSAVQ